MANKNAVIITGKTFDEINAADLKVISNSSQDDNFLNSLKEYDKIALIKEILDTIKNNIQNYTIGCSSKDKLFLYSDFNDKSYYGGIAGVLRKQSVDITNCLADLAAQYNTAFSNDDGKIDVTLRITTKFDNEKPYFLATMMLSDKIVLNENTVPSNEEEIFDYLLLFSFKEQLEKACQKGLYRTYRRFEGNDDRLRGTIDFARHIKLNAGQNNGKIAYSYRERTTNNYLNYLIVAAYMHLKEKYFDLVTNTIDSNFDLLAAIRQLKNDTGYYKGGEKSIISKNLKAITHPLLIEYEELRVISIKILRDEGLSIFDGENDDTKGILFYVPTLWENFLESRMLSCVDTLKSKAVQLESQNELWVLSKPNQNGFFFNTRPDYVFFNAKEPVFVLDAKFKPAWNDFISSDSSDGNNTYRNMSDDYTKCVRDMTDYGVSCSGVIFPCDADKYSDYSIESDNLKHSISKYNNTNCFYTLPVKIPKINGSDYTIWKNEFDECVKNDVAKINDILSSIINLQSKNQ